MYKKQIKLTVLFVVLGGLVLGAACQQTPAADPIVLTPSTAHLRDPDSTQAHLEWDATVQNCVLAQLTFFNQIAKMNAEEGQSWEASDLYCKGLYKEPVCDSAWKRALTKDHLQHVSPEKRVADIIAQCRLAYCDKLPMSSESVCTASIEPTDDQDNSKEVETLIALDTAILVHELGDAKLANALAQKGLVFLSKTVSLSKAVSIDLPKRDMGDKGLAITIFINKTGAVWVNGEKIKENELLEFLKKQIHTPKLTRVIISADKNVAHEQVVHVINSVKTLGIKKFAVSIGPSKQP